MASSEFFRKGFSWSAKKSVREILTSTTTERQAPFQPITSGVSPLAQDCSERTMPQRYRVRSHCSARRTSCAWVMVQVLTQNACNEKYFVWGREGKPYHG